MTVICEACRCVIYPSDERVYWDYGNYHVECAEGMDIPDDDEIEEA